MKGKIGHSMSHGCRSSRHGRCRGLALTDGVDVLLADSAHTFARRSSDFTWTTTGRQAAHAPLAHVRRHFSESAARTAGEDLLRRGTSAGRRRIVSTGQTALSCGARSSSA
jgi:hypothetical protein